MYLFHTAVRELFDELVSEAHTKGISPQWMKRAASVTVSCYREDKLRDIAEQCVMLYKGKAYDVPGWYILCDDKFYDEKTGLHFTDDSSLDLHKYKVTDTAEPYVTVFKARLEQGVLNVPPFDSGEVLKPERGE